MDATPAVAAHSFKVVVAGSFAAGKSTLIRIISDSEVVGTEAPTSGSEAAVKDTTTVGMEYGTMHVGDGPDGIELALFGLPGQERFRFLWDIVAKGADGALVLVDADRPETWDETREVAAHLRRHNDLPLVIGINRLAPDETIDHVAEALDIDGAEAVRCDVIEPESAREALVSVLLLVLDRLDDAELVTTP